MNARKLRVLFVDDNPAVLEGLRRMFFPLSDRWELAFAANGKEALRILHGNPCHVVITDVRMPFMEGVFLLKEIKKSFPQTTRIVLSGQSGIIRVLRAAGAAHQYLSRPCGQELLRSTIERTEKLRAALPDAEIEEILFHTDTLPTLPGPYLQLTEELQSEESSLRDIARIISRDMAMSTKILQLVNSAYFGMRRQILNLEQAVNFLGLETIKGLVLGIGIFTQFAVPPALRKRLSRLWDHSLKCATMARGLAIQERLTKAEVDECFAAAMIHDIGKLVLCTKLPDRYGQVLEHASRQNVTDWKAEQELLGFSHAEIGAYLIGLWGLPPCLFEVAAYHHLPEGCPEAHWKTLYLVQFVNQMEGWIAAGKTGGGNPWEFESPGDSAGWTAFEKREQWPEFCRQTLLKESNQ